MAPEPPQETLAERLACEAPWLPPAVAEKAIALLPYRDPLVWRLATHPEMEKVWKVVKQRRFWKVKSLLGSEQLACEMHGHAMARLFLAATKRYAGVRRTIARVELEEQQRPHFEMAKQLREDAERLRALGGWANADAIARMAAEQEMYARRLGQRFGQAVVDRDIGNMEVRGYLVRLLSDTQVIRMQGFADYCSLFATPLYGSMATIASVVFERPVTAETVRQIRNMLLTRATSQN